MERSSVQITQQESRSVASSSLQALAQGSMFWRPAHTAPSAWLHHLPWLFWMMEALKPSRCVTLGVSEGSPHLAFCQAVSRLGLEGECLLIQRSGNTTADEVHGVAERLYGSASSWIQSNMRRGARVVESGSVDVLAFDLFAEDDEDLEDLVDRWLPKLSDQGVMLFAGINRDDGASSTYQVFAELSKEYPAFHFNHGEGLGILLVGSQPNILLQTMQERFESANSATLVRDVFSRLGRGCADQVTIAEQKNQLGFLNQRLTEVEDAREELHRAQLSLQAKDSDIDKLNHALELKEKEIEAHFAQLAEYSASFDQAVAAHVDPEPQFVESDEPADSSDIEDEEKRALEEQVANYEQQLSAYEENVYRLNAEVEDKDKALNELRVDHQQIVDQLEKSESEIARLSSDHQSSQEHMESQLAREKRIARRQKEELEDLVRNSAKKVDQLTLQIEALSKTNEQNKLQIEELRRAVEERDSIVAVQLAEMERLEKLIKSPAVNDPVQSVDVAQEPINVQPDHPEMPETSTPVALAPQLKNHNHLFDRRKKRKLDRLTKDRAYLDIAGSKWFDAEWYLQQNADVAADDVYSIYPALHYLKFGGFEGRNPCAHFNSQEYLDAYPDVVEAGINPLLHFVRVGEKEGR